MTPILSAIVWNSVIASGLAVLVGLSGHIPWLRRRPSVMHTLWLLVLAKFITPAFVPLPLLPAQPAAMVSFPGEKSPAPIPVTASVQTSSEQILSRHTPPDRAAVASPATTVDSHEAQNVSAADWPWGMLLLGISIVGSVLIALRTGVLMLQFHRWLRLSSVHNARLSHLLAICGERMGLRDVPEIRMLRARYSPFLWAGGRRSCIYIPQSMVDGFTDEQLSGILCHELAHYWRRDAWANLFAFGVATICWWNPLVWMARRRLSAVQELCCDAMVVARSDLSRRTYAETLYLTLGFIDRKSTLPNVLASGWDDASSLKSRFRMIGDAGVVPHSSRVFMVGALLLAASLVCFPIRAQESTQPRPQSTTEQKPVQPLEAANAAPQPSIQSERAATLKREAQTTAAVHMNGADFQAVALPLWPAPQMGEQSSIQLGLKITNRTQQKMQINLFESVRVLLRDAEDRELKVEWGRDRLSVPSPVVIPSGESRTISRVAKLERLVDYSGLRLSGPDETSGVWWCDQLQSGNYTLSFEYENNGDIINILEDYLGKLTPPANQINDPLEAPYWIGKATTAWHAVEIADPVHRQQRAQREGSSAPITQIHPTKVNSEQWLKLKERLTTSGMSYRMVSINEKGFCHLSLGVSTTSDLTPLKGTSINSLDVSHTPVADLSPLEGMPLQTLDVSGSEVANLTPLKGMPLTALRISGTKVRDLSPVTGAKLTEFVASSTPVSDLSPLSAMPLTYVDIRRTAVKDLSPLALSPLESLQMEESPVADLSPLRKTPLELLRLTWTQGLDLSQLQGIPLKNLNLTGEQIVDLSPLRGMKLESLGLIKTGVKDLTPLQDVPLKGLQIEGSPVTDLTPLKGSQLVNVVLYIDEADLSPLAGLPLETIGIPSVSKVKNIEVLRGIRTLKWIRPPECKPIPTADFWRSYDAGGFSK